MRRSRSFLAALGLLLALAAPVGAKGDVEARLDAPFPRDAAPGTTVTVGWTLAYADAPGEVVWGTPNFIRVHPVGGEPVEVTSKETAEESGHYVATFEVPAGGIARFEIGLPGQACDADGCRRVDHLPPVVEPAAGGAAAPLGTEPEDERGAAGPDGAPVVPLVGGGVVLAALAALAASAVLVARRRDPDTA